MDAYQGGDGSSAGGEVSFAASAQRCERAREMARRQGLDGILIFSWQRGVLSWFTGYRPGFVTNYAALWLPVQGEPLLGTRFPYEAERAAHASGVRALGGVAPIELIPTDARSIGLVGGDFAIDETPPSLLAELNNRKVDTVDLRDVIDAWRALKSPDEIEAHGLASEIGNLALQAAGPYAVEGMRDYDIAGMVEGAARVAGAFRTVCLVGIGHGAVVTEAHGKMVHMGDPICLEVTITTERACTQVNGTILPLKPGDQDVRAVDISKKARAALLRAMIPGVSVDDVVAVGDRILQDAGLLDAKEYDFGHGLGVDTPELPRLITGTGQSIQTGHLLAVHVALRRASGETSFLGGPVVVGTEGSRELAPSASWSSL